MTDTLERMRDAEFLTALRTAWANVKAAWFADDSTQAYALIEMDLLLGVNENGQPLDAETRQIAADEVASVASGQWDTDALDVELFKLRALADAVRAARTQRDPRHRVSMLLNDWQAIEDALA